MRSNRYVFKALDAYPYNLEEVAESLEYALSYDREDTTALCLMGRMHSEILRDFDRAKNYFLEALAVDVHAIEVYPHYVNVLIWNEDLADADKFIDFALKVKGSDKACLLHKKACLQESQQKLKKAGKILKMAKEKAVHPDIVNAIKETEQRIKRKMEEKEQGKKENVKNKGKNKR